MPGVKRIHILGASGSGTSTLGRALASRLNIPFFDSDDFFWEATDPPFTTKRAPELRAKLLAEKTAGNSFVLSGSAIPWGDFLRTRYSHLIFLSLPAQERLARISAREASRYGARLGPGGDMHQAHLAFLEWAALYDNGDENVRSRKLHESWMRAIPCPVLRLDSLLPTEKQTALAEAFFAERVQFEIRQLPGNEAAPLVDSFYAGLNRTARARADDTFFVAIQGRAVIGCVRFCVEEGVPMLRGMLIAERARKQGIGNRLLAAFEAYLRELNPGPVLCLPHAHLESFYGKIGFVPFPENEAPEFLQRRISQYRQEGMPDVIMMRRA